MYLEIKKILDLEAERQRTQVELIASENFTSQAVMDLTGSIFTNKYAEGRPGRRYYNGCEHVDQVENLAEDLVKQIYGCEFANVQPHSGAQANAAVFLALLNPGDRVLSLSLDHGGHLSHGSPVNMSGKWFTVKHYGVSSDGKIDYDQLQRTAQEFQPHLIISGASAYSFQIDWHLIDAIAKSVNAYHLADFSHYSGLIAGSEYDSPIGSCDVATSTTHKTLRGPRGGMILWNRKDLTKKLNMAVFPGTQGGPLMHVIAAKAQCFWEASQPGFARYAGQVVKNARAMSQEFQNCGIPVVGGGTQCHMFTINVGAVNLTGKAAADIMEAHGYTANANTIPNDPNPPAVGSGVRIGTAAMTTKGWEETEFTQAAAHISEILKR